MFLGRAAWESRSSIFYKNNYYFIAIRVILRSRLYKINQNELFCIFFQNNFVMLKKSTTFAPSNKKQEV